MLFFFTGTIFIHSFFGWLYTSIILFISYLTAILLSRKIYRNEFFTLFLILFFITVFIYSQNERVIFDMLRYLTPFFAFFIGYRLNYVFDNISFNKTILNCCITFFIIAFLVSVYSIIQGLSGDEMRKILKISPFMFIYFWVLISSSDNFIYSGLLKNIFFLIGLLLFLIQDSRTILFILIFLPFIYILSNRSIKTLFSLSIFFGIALLVFLNFADSYLDNIINRGISEIFYSPSTHGLERATLYNHWRGYEIYRVIEAVSNASMFNILFGHGPGSAIPLGFNIPIGENVYSEVDKIHSLFFEVLFKFGFLGLVLIAYILFKMLTDRRLGLLSMRFILVFILLISSTVTAALLYSWIIFIWWGFQSSYKNRSY